MNKHFDFMFSGCKAGVERVLQWESTNTMLGFDIYEIYTLCSFHC